MHENIFIVTEVQNIPNNADTGCPTDGIYTNSIAYHTEKDAMKALKESIGEIVEAELSLDCDPTAKEINAIVRKILKSKRQNGFNEGSAVWTWDTDNRSCVWTVSSSIVF